jgi:hypothetical protein
MSYLPVPPPEMEEAFTRFLAEHTTRTPVVYITPVWALRAAFRRFVRELDLCNKPSDAQFNWMLDDAMIQVENLPEYQTKVRMPHACGIRLVEESSK